MFSQEGDSRVVTCRVGSRRSGTGGKLHRALVLALACFLVACGGGPGVGPGAGRGRGPGLPATVNYHSHEPAGDYYVGRRFHLEGTRLWGYVRRPREPWSKARLVVMNESMRKQPDRLPEKKRRGPSHGYDHNYEYHLRGKFSGEEVYDPNSNLFVPEFVLKDYREVSKAGGDLVRPGDMNDRKRLPQLW